VSDVVRCGCGYGLEGDEAEDMLADAERHVRIAHPELLGTLSPLELARPLEADHAAAA
jgi:hypothetical protein